MDTLLLVLDLTGTFVFALSGAAVATKYRLDIFGVLVLAFVTGNAGGITRDLVIGAVPPSAVGDWRYLAVSIGAGLVTFAWYPHVQRLHLPIIVLDAAGLAFFAVAGAQKALVFGLNPPMAILLGMLTGIGGGMLRDILVNEIPAVLRAELYASAAIVGAAIVVIGHGLALPPTATTIFGAGCCFALRVVSVWRNWQLPHR